MKKEIWKDIINYGGDYQISNFGNIKSVGRYVSHLGGKRYITCKFLAQRTDYKGYKQITIRGKSFRIHRLVAIAFIPNLLNKPQINHIDANKKNNIVTNLEWCTNRENQIHSNKLGLRKNTKHTEETKIKISKALKLKNIDHSYHSRKVTMFNRDTHKKIKDFVSISDAIKYLMENGFSKAEGSSISNSCKKIRGYYKGNCYNHYWEYMSNNGKD